MNIGSSFSGLIFVFLIILAVVFGVVFYLKCGYKLCKKDNDYLGLSMQVGAFGNASL